MPPVAAGSRLELQLPGSIWSSPVPLDAVGTHGLVEVEAVPPAGGGAMDPSLHFQTARPGCYQLGVSITACPGMFGRSKTLTVGPRVMLCNALPHHAIAFKQHGVVSAGDTLFPGDTAPFHWHNPTFARLLSVGLLRKSVDRADDTADALANCDWSCAFPINDVDDFTIVIKPPDPETRRQKLFLHVDIQVDGSESRVVFSLQEAALAPYRIDNLTRHSVLVAQSPCQELEHPRVVEEVPPGGKAPFAWEQITEHPTLDVHVANVKAPVCLDDLALRGTILIPPASSPERLRFRTAVDGPIKVLQLLPAHDGPVPAEAEATDAEAERVHHSLSIHLSQIGLSLVDSTPRELLYLSVRNLRVQAVTSKLRSSMTLTVQSLQVDNQLQGAVFPVLLRPSWTEEEATAEGGPASAVEVRVGCSLANPGLLFYETIAVRVQTVQLMVDTLLVRTLLLFYYELRADLASVLSRLLSSLLPAIGIDTARDEPRKTDKIYLHRFHTEPLRILVSCRSVAGGIGLEDFARGAPAGAVGLLNSVGALLSNVDRVPLKLKALNLENAFAPAPVMLAGVGASYKEQILSQLYKVLLSFEVLGNPRGLFKKMGTGMHDFFYEPLQGFMSDDPAAFERGVQAGKRSFHDNVVVSMGDSMQRASTAMAKGLAELTMDTDFLQKRSAKDAALALEVSRNQKPQSRTVKQGMMRGADTIGSAFARGAQGVVKESMRGADRDGLEGFARGLAKGAVGFFVKPLVGAADAVSDSLQHSLHDRASNQGVFAQRARPPRTLGASGQLRAYSRADADMQQQLAVLCQGGGKRFASLAAGRYIASCAAGGARAFGTKRLVVTTTHVASLHLGGAGTGSAAGSSRDPDHGSAQRSEPATLEWFEPLSRIGTLEESSSELVLHLRDGGMRFVPVAAGAQERRDCFRMLSDALRTLGSDAI